MSDILPAPDGGYGWVMAVCSFYVQLWTIGLCFSLGGLYVSWLQEFGESKALTSWVVSIYLAFLTGMGPLASVLISKYGNRVTQIIGALLSCAGFSLSYFVTSVYQLIITVGVVSGTGMAFCYTPAITMLAEYFDKRRAVAYGIATSGAGIGNFVLSPLIDWLENIYGWRGVLLILGALLLNLSVCALLMKPLIVTSKFTYTIETIAEHGALQNNGIPLVSFVQGNDVQSIEIECLETSEKYVCVLNNGKEHKTSDDLVVDSSGKTDEKNHLNGSVPDAKNDYTIKNTPIGYEQPTVPYNKYLDSNRLTNGGSRRKMGGSFQQISQPIPRANKSASVSEIRQTNSLFGSHQTVSTELGDVQGGRSSFRKKDLLFCGSLHSLLFVDEKLGSKKSLQYSMLSYNDDRDDDEEVHTNGNHIETSPGKNFAEHPCIRRLKPALEFMSILKDPVFLSLAASQFLVNLSYIMPVLYMVDRAIEYDISKDSAIMLLSINGIGNLIGRFLWGILGDMPGVDTGVLFIIALIICGISTCLSPICGGNFILHSIYAAIFGITIGGYASLLPVVVVDFLGVARMRQVYGILLFSMGIASSIGPPFAGVVYDLTGDFSASFILHGAAIILSSASLLPVTISRLKRSDENTIK